MELPSRVRMQSARGVILVPSVGFGTWAEGDTSWCYKATLEALKAGYRHIDCAWDYNVDDAVGAAICDSKIPREELFITSKFWPQFAAPENVERCLDQCLESMGLDYFDLFLAHWPIALQASKNLVAADVFAGTTNEDRCIDCDIEGKPTIDWAHTCASIAAANGQTGSFKSTWQAMQGLVESGKVRAIGVSNFNSEQLQEILDVGGEVPVSCNQIEAHPWFSNTELIVLMEERNILATVYSPFGGDKAPVFLNNPIIQQLMKKTGMGAGQLLQSWAVQRGTVPLGKSQTFERIRANLNIQTLAVEDFNSLSSLNQGDKGRTCDLGPEWGVKFF